MSEKDWLFPRIEKWMLRNLKELRDDINVSSLAHAIVYLLRNASMDFNELYLNHDYIYELIGNTGCEERHYEGFKEIVDVEKYELVQISVQNYLNDVLKKIKKDMDLKNMTEVIGFLMIKSGYSFDVVLDREQYIATEKYQVNEFTKEDYIDDSYS